MNEQDYNILFTKWYEQYYPMAKSIIANYTGLRGYIKDIFHNSLIVLYEKIVKNELRLTSEVGAYLRGIINNKCKELDREKNLGKAGNNEFKEPLIPDDEAYNNEREMIINKLITCIEGLSDTRKKIILNYYYSKLSMDEIANKHGFENAASVKSQKYKAIQDLKNCIDIFKI